MWQTGQSSAWQNGLSFLPRYRTTRGALVKATKNKTNPVTDEIWVENQTHGLASLIRQNMPRVNYTPSEMSISSNVTVG